MSKAEIQDGPKRPRVLYRQAYATSNPVIDYGVSCTVPDQDYDVGDLLRRFSNGQRLSVNERPINFLQDGDADEDFSNIQPQCDDIVDVLEYQEETAARKAALKERREAKREKAAKEAADKKNLKDSPKTGSTASEEEKS